MQTVLNTPTPPTAGNFASALSGNVSTPVALSQYQIIRRNGAVVPFEPNKIAVAMMKAFLAVHGTQGAASASVRDTVEELTQGVVRALMPARARPVARSTLKMFRIRWNLA
jgi:ribonucleoside-diphosphate reductase alpha chain